MEIPLRIWLFTPEWRWQSRGKRRISQGFVCNLGSRGPDRDTSCRHRAWPHTTRYTAAPLTPVNMGSLPLDCHCIPGVQTCLRRGSDRRHAAPASWTRSATLHLNRCRFHLAFRTEKCQSQIIECVAPGTAGTDGCGGVCGSRNLNQLFTGSARGEISMDAEHDPLGRFIRRYGPGYRHVSPNV